MVTRLEARNVFRPVLPIRHMRVTIIVVVAGGKEVAVAEISVVLGGVSR